MVRTGATFAEAAEEWLRYVEQDRDVKPSTLTDYRSVLKAHLLPTFGEMRLEAVTPQRVEAWRASLGAERGRPLANRTCNKSLTILGGVMERARKVYGLPSNPVRDVEKLRERDDATRFEFYSPEEVHALVRAAASEPRSDLHYWGLHWPPPRGADRVALARRRLRARGDTCRGELCQRQPHDTEVGTRPGCPDGARGR